MVVSYVLDVLRGEMVVCGGGAHSDGERSEDHNSGKQRSEQTGSDFFHISSPIF